MEQYVMENRILTNENSINIGKFANIINKQHIISYGEEGAANTLESVSQIFKSTQIQLFDQSKNNNVLLVGKVQSGKTSNLEMFTALAFDNGYNMVIIYGGYDKSLLKQTKDRFADIYGITTEPTWENDDAVIFSTDDRASLANLDGEIVSGFISRKKPIILVSMKRPDAMRKINKLLKKLNKDIHAFVIDDEGDQASLNTSRDKQNDASATYKEICEIKNILNDPLYLSVTATPQANIFLNEYSKLIPDSIRLISPANGYCGAEVFHLEEDKTEIINPDHTKLDEGQLPESIKDAINYYILASAIKRKINHKYNEYSDMIIHSYRNTDPHMNIYTCVKGYIDSFKDLILHNEPDLVLRYKELEKCYQQYFDNQICDKYPITDLFSDINDIVTKIYIILKNAKGHDTQVNEKLRYNKIYIGGDLLQRGITFKHLITTYFTRWPNDGGNMDTNLQRARWFGYRSPYIKICKNFMTEDICEEFTNLAEIELDLWEQFNFVQNGEFAIDDILIKSNNTKQKPTRSNVVKYEKISFTNLWLKQRNCIFDKKQIANNNSLIENLMNNINLKPTSKGRRDNGTSAYYGLISKDIIVDLIKSTDAVFDINPFDKNSLIKHLDEITEIPLIIMAKDKDKPRERALYPNSMRIKVLHQGADSKDKDKVIYEGDSSVIIDRNRINIQVHKIMPVEKNAGPAKPLPELIQYMFAFYLPKQGIYFKKG